MMPNNVTLDDMFPRAEPVTQPPLPVLKTEKVYNLIRKRAKQHDLELTAERMAVINFVLDFYETCDDCQNARALADIVQEEFAAQGGRKYLYQLFPAGPLSTIHALADLPALGNETDKSFGTRW